MFQRLHHVGIVTDDLDAATQFYEHAFGARFQHRERLEVEGVDVAIAVLPQGGEIELLAPFKPDTGVARFLARRGPGLHHTGYAAPRASSSSMRRRATGREASASRSCTRAARGACSSSLWRALPTPSGWPTV